MGESARPVGDRGGPRGGRAAPATRARRRLPQQAAPLPAAAGPGRPGDRSARSAGTSCHADTEGTAEQAELDRRSDAVAACAARWIWTRASRSRLVGAMAEVERLVAALADRHRTRRGGERRCPGLLRALLRGAGRAVPHRLRRDAQQSRRYRRPDPATRHGAPCARIGEDPVGCGALLFHGDGIATLKRMWVAPRVRGTGLGRRLLVALEDAAARRRGVTVIRLETNLSLTEAIAMYRSAGYRRSPRSTTSRTPTTGSRSGWTPGA